MRCEVHRALAFEGDLVVDDPDGIVVEAAFAAADAVREFLALCAPWVREPLADWIEHRWGPRDRAGYAYDVFGTSRDDLRVVRTAHLTCARDMRTDASILHVDLDAFYASVEQLDDPTPARSTGDRRRTRAARRGRRGELRGARLRRVLGDADGARPPRLSRRRVPRAPVRPLPRRQHRRDGDPALVHAAGRADLARRGVPRRRRRPPRRTAPGPSIARGHPHAGARRDRAHRLGRRRHHQAAGQAGQRPRQARRPARRRAGHRARVPPPAAGPAGCGASARRPNAGSPRSACETVGDLAAIPEDTLVRDARQRVGPPPARAGVEPRRAAGRARPGGEVDRPRGDLPDRPPRPRRARAPASCGLADGVASRLRGRARRPPAPCSSRCASATSAPSPGRARSRQPTDLAADLGRVARELLAVAGRRPRRAAARHLGPAARAPGRPPSGHGRRPIGHGAGGRSGTEPGGADQGTLFPDPDRGADESGGTATPPAGERRQAALERSVDAVRARFGPGAVGPGRANSLPREGPGPPRVEWA